LLGPLFDLIEIGVLVLDPEDVGLLAVNPMAARMFHCSSEQACTAPLEKILVSEEGFTHDRARDMVKRALAGKQPSEEWHCRSFSGETFWAQVDLRTMDSDGHHLILALIRDISREKQQKESLLESESGHRAMIEAFDGLIYICSKDYHVEYMNPRFIERTGRNAVGEPCFKALHQLDAVCPWCVNDRVMAGETVRWEVKSPLDDRWYYVVNTPIRHTDGSISKQAMILDITDRKTAEEDRIKLEADIQRSQKLESLGVLAGGVAHDFNNLLLVIIGHLDLVRLRLPEDSPVQENIGEGLNAAYRAAELCKQMLAYAGKGRVEFAALNINEKIAEMDGMLHSTVARKAALTFFPQPGEVPMIHGDGTQIQQIILNLVLNSLEAMNGKPGIISITTGIRVCQSEELTNPWMKERLPTGPYVFVEIRDSGSGIPAEVFPRIFDPFFSTKFAGRGLGLAAVMGIIKLHRGTIQVDTTPGKGTVFTVFLPRQKTTEPEPMGTSEPENNRPIGRGFRLLVVDDEPMVRELLIMLLENFDFHVDGVGSGKEAVELIGRNPEGYSGVILDMTLPGMSGPEILRQMREIRPDIPVIVSSGFPESDVKSEFVGLPIAGILQKPFRMEELFQLCSSSFAAPKPR
jgi:PAS domain S-box-containing protein